MSSEKKELIPFDALKADIEELVSPVNALTVTDFKSGQNAIDAGKQVKELFKRVEAVRKGLVDPLNKRVKTINEYAKSIGLPLMQAEEQIKAKLSVFEREQEKIRQAALRLAEEEEKKRRAELEARQQAERAALQSKLSETTEVENLFGTEEGNPVAPAAEILALQEKQDQELAVAKSQAAQKEWDIAQMGLKNARKTWKCEVTDLSLVPKEFLIFTLNEKAVLAMAKEGVTNIPGVRLWQETSVALGANTYVPRLALKSGR